MNHILRPLLDECVVVYLDDILIYSRDMKQHVEHLRRVFEILRRERFYVKLSKSEFALEKVQFLGHLVSAQGVHVDPKKIEAVRTWKTPENVKELQQFLGFANYYNRFVPQYAKLAAPLTNLLKKNTSYKWETKHQEAVEQLKQALTSAPVLILPDPERDYVIEADASDQAVGAVLMQDQGNGLQPIAYLSKKLHGAELNYPIHDKEALAIVIAFKAWRCYLEGRRKTVYTDHCSLKYLKTQPNLSRRQVRWIDFLETHFHYDIVYKPGHKNKADALSRPAHRTSPVLRIADPHRPFEVITDVSDIAIGAVLLQDFGEGLQPIVYELRKLHPLEQNYPIHEKEMLAIMHAFKVWRCYMTAADVIVQTDHRSVQYDYGNYFYKMLTIIPFQGTSEWRRPGSS
ncbi:hypothetical protein CLOP_g709 [Closterium sp. NIES-67]|nr:hypothetical protein CLOP_g709 [Closterium sp. NIES-67]